VRGCNQHGATIPAIEEAMLKRLAIKGDQKEQPLFGQ
jgi:hypothetical protein